MTSSITLSTATGSAATKSEPAAPSPKTCQRRGTSVAFSPAPLKWMPLSMPNRPSATTRRSLSRTCGFALMRATALVAGSVDAKDPWVPEGRSMVPWCSLSAPVLPQSRRMALRRGTLIKCCAWHRWPQMASRPPPARRTSSSG